MMTRTQQSIPEFEALVLAGGRGSRLGGVDKASLTLGGERLVDRVVRAVRAAGAERVVVSGPESSGTLADAVVREEPAYAGPLAGIGAALPELHEEWVMILACDLQRPRGVVSLLTPALAELAADSAAEGAVLCDSTGRIQWLAGLYRTAALRRACAAEGNLADAPVRRVLGALNLMQLPVDEKTSIDIDTPQALEDARRNERKNMAQHLPPEALQEWLQAAAASLELEGQDVDIATVLDAAKHVAHEVARPAAPLSTFLLGLSVGLGKGELSEQAEILIERAHQWAKDNPQD